MERARLRPGSGLEDRLGLGQRARRVGNQASRVADSRVDRRAGRAVAEGHVPLAVHVDTPHPAGGGVRGIGSLLEERRDRRPRRPDLVPPRRRRDHSRAADAVGHDERLVRPEVPVVQAPHQPVSERIELVRRPGLRDAGAGGLAGVGVRGDGDGGRGREREGRVARRRPVDVERPEEELVRAAVPDGEEVVRSARRGHLRSGEVQVGRQEAAVVDVRAEALLGRTGIPRDHLHPVEGADLGARPPAPVGEDVVHHVVAVRPDSAFPVIVEVASVVVRVGVPGAQRVGRLRDGNALEVGRRADGELRQEPAVGEGVVENEGVAVVVRRAAPPEAREQGVPIQRAEELRSALVPDREHRVDPLDVVVGTDVAFRVRRGSRHGEAGQTGSRSLEVPDRRRHGGGPHPGLEDRFARNDRGQDGEGTAVDPPGRLQLQPVAQDHRPEGPGRHDVPERGRLGEGHRGPDGIRSGDGLGGEVERRHRQTGAQPEEDPGPPRDPARWPPRGPVGSFRHFPTYSSGPANPTLSARSAARVSRH